MFCGVSSKLMEGCTPCMLTYFHFSSLNWQRLDDRASDLPVLCAMLHDVSRCLSAHGDGLLVCAAESSTAASRLVLLQRWLRICTIEATSHPVAGDVGRFERQYKISRGHDSGPHVLYRIGDAGLVFVGEDVGVNMLEE